MLFFYLPVNIYDNFLYDLPTDMKNINLKLQECVEAFFNLYFFVT